MYYLKDSVTLLMSTSNTADHGLHKSQTVKFTLEHYQEVLEHYQEVYYKCIAINLITNEFKIQIKYIQSCT